jgi:hypothetical protein
MKALLIIGVSWFLIGLISYLLILCFFPPTPILNLERSEVGKWGKAGDFRQVGIHGGFVC